VTSSSSFSDNAAGKVLLCDSTAPTAITLTFTAAAKANFAVTIIRNGTGNVIIANSATIQKQNTTSYTTANISSQFAAATVLYTATNKFILLGDIT
jgi:methionine-rich copper-binding protein CopC